MVPEKPHFTTEAALKAAAYSLAQAIHEEVVAVEPEDDELDSFVLNRTPTELHIGWDDEQERFTQIDE